MRQQKSETVITANGYNQWNSLSCTLALSIYIFKTANQWENETVIYNSLANITCPI